jgi:ankyrin repeat protein
MGRPDAVKVEELVNTLIQKGIDVNVADDSGFTALHYASAHNNPRIVEALIAAGADVNAQVDDLNANITPLFFAVRSGSLGVIDALIRAGADVSARDTAGSTPLDLLSVKSWDPVTSNFIVNPDIVRIIVLLNNAGISRDKSVALRAKWLKDGLTPAQIAEIVRNRSWKKRRNAVVASAIAMAEREGPSSENENENENENQDGGKRRKTRKHRSKKRKNTRRNK